MKTKTAIEHFGSVAKLAGALKISRTAIYLWEDDVPDGRAYQLEVMTAGALKAAAEAAGAEAGPSTAPASADTLNRELAAVGGLCEQVDSTLGAFERVIEASDAERLNRQMDALDKICDRIENPPAAAAGAATGRGSGEGAA